MFASIRRYDLRSGALDALTRRVDDEFAERLSRRRDFVSYELLDCGAGDVMTISVFRDAAGAHASRALAEEWVAERLRDFDLARREALQGEILVSRAAEAMLEPGHPGAGRRFASIRRYTMSSGSVGELMRSVDDVFADEIASVPSFVAYHAIDCGGGQLLSVSVFTDRAAADESDEMALRFVTERLTRYGLQRTEAVVGEVLVSRAVEALLVPTHA